MRIYLYTGNSARIYMRFKFYREAIFNNKNHLYFPTIHNEDTILYAQQQHVHQ